MPQTTVAPIHYQDPLSDGDSESEISINLSETDALFEDPDAGNPHTLVAQGYRLGASLKQFLAANVRHTMNVMQLATYAILIFQLKNPSLYNTESCEYNAIQYNATSTAVDEDQGLVSYFWGFVIGFLGINLVSFFADVAAPKSQAASTFFRWESEGIDAIGTGVYTYLGPARALGFSPQAALISSILSGFYPIACLIMRMFNKEFARGDWEDYQYYFQDSKFKQRLGILLESFSNGLNLASTCAMLTALIMDTCYNSWHENNIDPTEYNRFVMLSTAIGFLLGVILTKNNNLQTAMNKISTLINVFYVSWLMTLRVQGCLTSQAMYNPSDFRTTGWKYAAGWGVFSVALAAVSCKTYLNDTYNAIALERWLLIKFKCQPCNWSLRRIITDSAKLLGTMINASFSAAILREPAYGGPNGYTPVLTAKDQKMIELRQI